MYLADLRALLLLLLLFYIILCIGQNKLWPRALSTSLQKAYTVTVKNKFQDNYEDSVDEDKRRPE